MPRCVATRAVRSYRTFSPLPARFLKHALAVCFLWHFPWTHVLQALPGALSEGARTFLRQYAFARPPAIAWPTLTFSSREWYPNRASRPWSLTPLRARCAGNICRRLCHPQDGLLQRSSPRLAHALNSKLQEPARGRQRIAQMRVSLWLSTTRASCGKGHSCFRRWRPLLLQRLYCPAPGGSTRTGGDRRRSAMSPRPARPQRPPPR